MSTVSAKHLIGQALELRHRLPRLWRRVQGGDLPAWRARRVAETTIHAGLSPEAAAYVDAQLAPYAHRTSASAVDRLVDAAIVRFDPDRAAAEARVAADGRHVTIQEGQVSFAGTMRITAELDLADALDLSAAVTHGAEQLKQLGSEEPLDARRASAVGEMARRQLSFDLVAGFETGLRPSSTSEAVPLVAGFETGLRPSSERLPQPATRCRRWLRRLRSNRLETKARHPLPGGWSCTCT